MQDIGMPGEMVRHPIDGQRGSNGGMHLENGMTPDI
jgi:hypothetical protein